MLGRVIEGKEVQLQYKVGCMLLNKLRMHTMKEESTRKGNGIYSHEKRRGAYCSCGDKVEDPYYPRGPKVINTLV